MGSVQAHPPAAVQGQKMPRPERLWVQSTVCWECFPEVVFLTVPSVSAGRVVKMCVFSLENFSFLGKLSHEVRVTHQTVVVGFSGSPCICLFVCL